eukprot:319889-Amorphochlora_amoeboformis.AAC.2
MAANDASMASLSAQVQNVHIDHGPSAPTKSKAEFERTSSSTSQQNRHSNEIQRGRRNSQSKIPTMTASNQSLRGRSSLSSMGSIPSEGDELYMESSPNFKQGATTSYIQAFGAGPKQKVKVDGSRFGFLFNRGREKKSPEVKDKTVDQPRSRSMTRRKKKKSEGSEKGSSTPRGKRSAGFGGVKKNNSLRRPPSKAKYKSRTIRGMGTSNPLFDRPTSACSTGNSGVTRPVIKDRFSGVGSMYHKKTPMVDSIGLGHSSLKLKVQQSNASKKPAH